MVVAVRIEHHEAFVDPEEFPPEGTPVAKRLEDRRVHAVGNHFDVRLRTRRRRAIVSGSGFGPSIGQ
jgi:hypothetical protein